MPPKSPSIPFNIPFRQCRYLSTSLPRPAQVQRMGKFLPQLKPPKAFDIKMRVHPRRRDRQGTTRPPIYLTYKDGTPIVNKGQQVANYGPSITTRMSDAIPDYPFGSSRIFKQINRGLYGGSKIQFGNNVSAKSGRQNKGQTKVRRRWWPNIHYKRLYSAALERRIRVRLTTRVLRTIDKVGGIDEYILGDKTGRIKELGPWGWALRWRLMQCRSVKKRFNDEREALGLRPKKLPPLASTVQKLAAMRKQVQERKQMKEARKLKKEEARAAGLDEVAKANTVEGQIKAFDRELDAQDAAADAEEAAELQGDPKTMGEQSKHVGQNIQPEPLQKAVREQRRA